MGKLFGEEGSLLSMTKGKNWLRYLHAFNIITILQSDKFM